MFGNMEIYTLQQYWWIICSVLGALFLFLSFVQGGQSLLWQVAKSEVEKSLVVNSLGRKWELTFTTLVTFGGAMFASFPKFYSTSFGGAYWVWMLILFTFIVQAVAYEYRKKPNNFLGQKVYELFLFINGTVGILLIGAAVATFFSGSNFTLTMFNFVNWTHPLRGVEAAFSLFNLSLGIFLVMNARTLGGLYLLNSIDFSGLVEFKGRVTKCTFMSFVISLPFLLYFLIALLLMSGQQYDDVGVVSIVANKYLANLLSMPIVAVMLLAGLVLVILGVYLAKFKSSSRGIWPAGLGTVLVGLTVFFLAGFNNTPFYPSNVDLNSSLTIRNASSGHYTLVVMSYVSLLVPFVLGYIFYFWRKMDGKKLSSSEVTNDKAY